MIRKFFLSILFAGIALVAAFGATGTKPIKQRVYMFGAALSFTDSVAVMTDLQGVDAYIMPNGFLADRSLYTLQFNNFLVSNQMRENMTCAVFFDKNKAKAEKKFQKVRRKYRESSHLVLQSVGVDLFRFEPEEWLDSEVVTTPSQPEQTDSINNAAKP